MNNGIQNTIVNIIGQKGYGKTVFTEKIIIGLGKATIIVDPRLQYKTDQKRRYFFSSPHEFKNWIVDNYRNFKKYKLELVIDTMPSEFEIISNIVLKMKNITFLVDEIDMFSDPKSEDKGLNKLIHYGRHNKIDIVGTSRRPANISRDLTSQTDFFYLSRISEPTDLKYFKARFGIEIVNELQNLDKFEFLQIDDENHIKKVKTTLKDLQILS